MPTPDPTPPDWDFYPCRVDGEPASILVDLSLAAAVGPEGPPEAGDPALGTTLYVVRLVRGEDPDEAGRLGSLEERLTAGAVAAGLRPVGRLRTAATWQPSYMGPAGAQDALGSLARELFAPREHDLVYQADPTWSYYRAFLHPDPERLRWIRDRRLVDRLVELGDDPTVPRRVDHVLDLPDAAARTAAAGEAIDLGFDAVDPDPDDDRRLELRRVHRVALDEVHGVVMGLDALAARHGGRYDGWGCEATGA